MHDIPYDNTQSVSHFEYVIEYQDSAAIKRQAFAHMDELLGWCSHEKAAVLIDLVLKCKPETVLEIGVFGGKSLVPMAYALKVNKKGKIFGIDPWDSQASIEGLIGDDHKLYWSRIDHESIMVDLMNKIARFALTEQIELLKTTSEAAAPIHNIDILHIDGNHSDVTSYLDVTKWVPYVRPGGWIIFDDINWNDDGNNLTVRAVDWLNENCIKFAEFSDTCVWGLWIKP